MPQVRVRTSAAVLLLSALTLSLTGCGMRLGAPKGNDNADAQVQAAQLKIEDQAWALRSIFFRPDFGPEWREIRDAGSKPTVGLPFKDCLSAAQGSQLDPATISADAGSPRFTRPNGAFAASNALVTTSPEQAAALYTMATTPEFASCIAKNTIDFRANPPVSSEGAESLATNVTAGDSTGTRVSVVYPGRGDANQTFVADFMVVKVDRAPACPVVRQSGWSDRAGRRGLCRPCARRAAHHAARQGHAESAGRIRCYDSSNTGDRQLISLCCDRWRVLRPSPCSDASTGAAPRARTRPRSRPPRDSSSSVSEDTGSRRLGTRASMSASSAELTSSPTCAMSPSSNAVDDLAQLVGREATLEHGEDRGLHQALDDLAVAALLECSRSRPCLTWTRRAPRDRRRGARRRARHGGARGALRSPTSVS